MLEVYISFEFNYKLKIFFELRYAWSIQILERSMKYEHDLFALFKSP